MICPRCDSDTAEKLVNAPQDKSWEVFLCKTCWFSWRSTEDEEVVNPARYSEKFKIKPDEISKLVAIPPIPPLK
jgi:hypothetical protein